MPFGDAAYYRARPKLGIPRARGDQGRRRLRLPSVDGRLRAALQGRPARPSSTAAATTIRACRTSRRWASGTPASRTAASRSDGWAGWPTRRYDATTRNVIVNLGNSQSLAVRSRQHSPLVFDDPGALPPRGHRRREAGARRAEPAARRRRTRRSSSSPSTAQNATESSDFVRQASAGYRTPVDYGIGGGLGGNLQRVAALIAAGMPTRLYYVTYSGQLVRHARAAGRSPQPAADVHRRRRARLHGGHRSASGAPTTWR